MRAFPKEMLKGLILHVTSNNDRLGEEIASWHKGVSELTPHQQELHAKHQSHNQRDDLNKGAGKLHVYQYSLNAPYFFSTIGSTAPEEMIDSQTNKMQKNLFRKG